MCFVIVLGTYSALLLLTCVSVWMWVWMNVCLLCMEWMISHPVCHGSPESWLLTSGSRWCTLQVKEKRGESPLAKVRVFPERERFLYSPSKLSSLFKCTHRAQRKSKSFQLLTAPLTPTLIHRAIKLSSHLKVLSPLLQRSCLWKLQRSK